MIAFKYTELYKTLLDKQIPIKYMNIKDEVHAYSHLYKGHTSVLFCGMKKWDNDDFTIYYYMRNNVTEDLRLSWDNNCYVVYEGVKYDNIDKLYASLENKKTLAILDNYLQ